MGYSCLHSASILQEAIASRWEKSKKVYIAFLDVIKAFDTVCYIGLMVKLHRIKLIFPHISGTYSITGTAVHQHQCDGITTIPDHTLSSKL